MLSQRWPPRSRALSRPRLPPVRVLQMSYICIHMCMCVCVCMCVCIIHIFVVTHMYVCEYMFSSCNYY